MPSGLRLGPYRFAPRLVPTLATAGLLPLLVGLGVWQLGRAAEKEALLDDVARRAHDAPMALAASHVEAEAMAFRRVAATGRYLSHRQYLLDNRIQRSRPGYHVLTPLFLEGTDVAVLVNRGWVPLGARREQLPDVAVDPAPRTVEGTVRSPGRPPPVLGPEDPGVHWPRVVQRVDLQAMAVQLGVPLLPFTVELAPEAADGFVRDWRPVVGMGPDKHRAYALQWFSLAALLLLLFVGLNTRRVEGVGPAGGSS